MCPRNRIKPKVRRKTLYGTLRKHLGEVFRKLAAQKESRIEEGHLLPDHVHMMIAIPRSTPCRRWWASSKERVRFICPRCMGAQAQFRRPALLARGYFVSTVGRDERIIREYIRKQEEADTRLEQLGSGDNGPPRRWPTTVGAALATRSSRF